jgi:hypothetical protein
MKRIARQAQYIASAALLIIGVAACSGESEVVDNDSTEGREANGDEGSAAQESIEPNADESTGVSVDAFCNGCYISFTACQQQVVPGSGCTCGTGVCGCSGAVPVGMTCP